MARGTRFDMEKEFAGLDFHSLRLEERFVRAMEALIQQPDKSIREASNEGCDRRGIVRARREAAMRRMTEYGGTILAVQDATGSNYNTRLKTEGIGYISDKTLGVNVRSRLAASADGLVLGALDQSACNRAEAKDEAAGHESEKARPIEEKERFRWLETLDRSAADIPEGVRVTTVRDREGDMAG
ncbi:MAG: hypothetical protein LBH85_04770 [Treponema sp.]|jgi:hypothetical protein|nr:hypothetical protein [Treponema sp.]